ncbi:hypothetical protein NEOLEDRAFT_1120069, partial [Neolentinus lepideus HHB14362 ss-1]
MSKRKQQKDQGDSESDSNVSLVDVDFEFFDPNPNVDYHALKRLLIQLFQADAELFHLENLTNLILGQPLIGTTVKTDGLESDPYAFLTVLNMHVHKNHPSVKSLMAYLLLKSASNVPLHSTLQTLIGSAGIDGPSHVGLILSERLINMPVQVVPPMYRMLAEEIKWAIDNNEPYRFDHLLFISRTYKLSPEEEAELIATAPRSSKRQRNAIDPMRSDGGVYSFHQEDEYIKKFASHILDFTFSNAQPREKDTFGLDTGGRIMLVPASNLTLLIAALNEAYAPP